MPDIPDTGAAVDAYLKSPTDPERAVRANVYEALGSSPDLEGELRRVSRETGVPLGSARAFPDEVKRRASMQAIDFPRVVKEFPRTAALLSGADNARLAHDDIDNLSGIEDRIRKFGELKPWSGPAPSLSSIAKGVWESFTQGGKQVREGLRMQGMDLMGESIADPLKRYQQAAARIDASTPEFETATARGLYGGLSSTARVLPGIAAAVATRNPNLALLSMGVQAESEAYGKYRARGATPRQAALGGIGEGAVEVATEMLPMGFLVDKFGKVGAKEFLAGMLGREIPSEQVATLLQDAIDTAVANPDKTWGQYLEERPDAAYQTLLATVVQTGIFGAANSVASRLDGGRAKAEYAERRAQDLEALNGLVAASKTMQRDATTAREFIAQLADEGSDAPTELYVDGATLLNTLNQSGMTMAELEAVAPVVAAQLAAAETGGDVRLPVSEFAGLGEKLTAPLIDHIRVGEDAPTRLEAKEFFDTQGAEFQAQVEKELARRDNAAGYRQSIAAVQQRFETELNTAGRFRPEVNKAYSTLLANFYGATAARLGMTPDELLNKYQLRAQSKMAGGARTMTQAPSITLADGYQNLKLGDSEVEVTLKDGHASINMVRTPTDKRGTGSARAALEQVVRAADAQGVTLTLTPEPMDRKTSKAKLGKFYKSLGFESNLGRKRDYRFSGKMIRRPAAGGNLNQAADAGAKWRADLAQAAKNPQFVAKLDAPAVLQSVGVRGPIVAPTRVLAQIAQDHPDVPASVVDNLPALLADPLFVIPHIDGGVNVVIDVKTAKGEPVLVGIRDGRLRTITPQHDLGAQTGQQRLDAKVAAATMQAGKMYARNKEALALTRASAAAPDGDNSLEALPRSKASVIYGDALRKGGVLDQSAPDTNAFQAWAEGLTVVEGGLAEYEGGPAVFVAYHGTTHPNITVFKEQGNAEGFLGPGPYFTTTAEDASANYAGVGPDLTGRIEREYENILQNAQDDTYAATDLLRGYFEAEPGELPLYVKANDPAFTADNWDESDEAIEELSGRFLDAAAKHAATQHLKGETDGLMMKTFVKLTKPADTTGRSDDLTLEQEVDEEGEYAGEPTGTLINFIEATRQVASQYGSEEQFDDYINALMENGESIGMDEVFSLAQKHLSDAHVYDDNGDMLTGGAVFREIAKEAGYDGVIMDAGSHFGPGRRGFGGARVPGMAGVDDDTLHIVAFAPEQIKSATGNRGTFDPNDKSILNQGTTPRAQIAFGQDITAAPSVISLLEGADFSSFVHESAHFFLEVQSDLAVKIQARIDLGETVTDLERGIVSDFNALLDWFGVKGDGPASGAAGGDLDQAAYHGTPHRGIDKFSTDKIGTGEGAQAYGWGLYFASKKEIAEHYRATLAGNDRSFKVDGETVEGDPQGTPEKAAVYHVGTNGHQRAIAWAESVREEGGDVEWLDRFDMAVAGLAGKNVERVETPKGQLYEVDLPEDSELLLWDKPLSEQPAKVREALAPFIERHVANQRKIMSAFSPAEVEREIAAGLKTITGQGIYEQAGYMEAGGDKSASEYLATLGIRGIKYLDGVSRNKTLRDVKREFLEELPEDADFSEVLDLIGSGTFSTKHEAILKALEANDWLGFDYPAQAISSALGPDLQSFDPSPELVKAIADAQDEGTHNFVIFSGDDVAIRNTFYQGGEQTDPGPSPMGRTPLETWSMMSLDEKRPYHEKFAEGFETFAMEGTAPSLELQGVFQRFRSWLFQIYKSLRDMRVKLDDDVRAVMGRMIATDQAIEEAEAARNMGPLFKDAESAGMTLDEFNAYQGLAAAATEKAVDELATRSLKDMKWLGRAHNKALKARQAEVEEQRRAVRMEVRSEVYSEPVYRAWQFLTGKGTSLDTALGEKAKADAGLDLTKDSLLTAIAKLGGISRDSAKRDLSVSEDDFRVQSGVFGKPVFRKEGGRNVDDMRQALTEYGYLFNFDEFGRTEIRELADLVSEELGGAPQYSASYNYALEMGPEPEAAAALPASAMYGKLNTDVLREMYGTGEDAVWRKLSALRMTNDKGVDPEALAASIMNDMGEPAFDSGDALVQALAAATPPKEVIEARTDQRMLERFGDISSPEALQRAADEAVHNEARARFIASELKALQASMPKAKDAKGRSTVNVMAAAAKDYAGQIIARLKVRDLRPGQYAAAEARNAKLADKAFAAAKTEEAAMHKRNQLVNNAAAKAAYDAQAEVKAAVAYMRKFDKRVQAVDAEYQDQIDGLLEAFDLKPASLKAIDKRASFADWYAEKKEAGLEPDVPPELLALSAKKSYKDMTVEELRGLVDTVKQIEHLGRLKNRLAKAHGKRELDAAVAEMVEHIKASKGVRDTPREGESRVRDMGAHGLAMMRKFSSYARQMDGVEDGPIFNALIRTANEAGVAEDKALHAAVERLLPLYEPLRKLKGGLTGDKRTLPGGQSLSRGGRLALLLNWGNEENRQRIQSGDGWGEAQVQAAAKMMTADELNFVNQVWAYLDSFWPETAALEKRIRGAAPKKVEAVPFTVTAADGTKVAMRGGYYPISYAPSLDAQASKHETSAALTEAANGAAVRAMTRHGHTKARTANVKRRVRLDLGVIQNHVQQVVHDLNWREWVIDANKVLNHKDFSAAVFERYGRRVHQALVDHVAAIATGDAGPRDAFDKTMLWARNNTSRAVMGLSLTTALLQPFGLLQSMQRIGVGPVLHGMKRWVGDAARLESTTKWVYEKSDVMASRGRTFSREMRELSNTIEGKSKAAEVFDAGLFFMIQRMQMIADVPTWIGQYEKVMAEGPAEDTDEAREALEAKAIAQADRAVIEGQGAGEIKDMAQVQRKHPLLTMFYSYFSATWQLVAESTNTTDFKNPKAVAGWVSDMMLLVVIPAMGPAIALSLLRGAGGDDDDDEPGKLAEMALKEQVSYLLNLFPLVRELSGIAKGFDYAGPPVGMVVGEAFKAYKQTAQGEIDEPFVLAYARALSLVFGLPVTQAIRSYKGWKAWDEGEAGPQAILLGPPPRD